MYLYYGLLIKLFKIDINIMPARKILKVFDLQKFVVTKINFSQVSRPTHTYALHFYNTECIHVCVILWMFWFNCYIRVRSDGQLFLYVNLTWCVCVIISIRKTWRLFCIGKRRYGCSFPVRRPMFLYGFWFPDQRLGEPTPRRFI